MICDMTGKQLMSLQLLDYGESSITIHANELQPGMFYYTLLVEGMIIDTKQMVLTN
jgi:hypothetical protein